ncbi:MAG: glycosyltransferase [Desulfobacteraceae bacterium]|nr:MAG: glycosyltransferase [Desulfobacteraceae bacterium]
MNITRPPKINVLFVLGQLGAGGSERVVLDLARHLDRDAFTVYAVYFSEGELLFQFKEVCQKVFFVEKKKGFDLKAIWRLAGIIRRNHIDVVNAHHYAQYFYSFAGAKIFNRCRLIFTEHAVSEIETMPKKHRQLCRLLFYQTDAIIGISEQITDCFRKAFPGHSRKMATIRNGLDIERFLETVDRTALRAGWGIQTADFVIGMVANFRRVKNHTCLIKAVHLLKNEFPQIRLVLTGQRFPNDPENTEPEIRDLVHSLDLDPIVIFTGYRDDIPNLLKTFDLFCLPSFSEGLPVSVLEAMASGIPVIGSDVLGINETISHEETGLLFPSDDAEFLSRAIQRLIREPQLCSVLKENAFDQILQSHSMDQWVNKYQMLFRGVI